VSSSEPGLLSVLEEARRRGLLGRRILVAEHIRHAEAWERVLPPAASIVDLGTGGGVPGLVLAVLRPHARGTLIEAAEGRCAFLRWAIGELGLGDRWEVRCDRAEDAAHAEGLRERFDGAVARGFGPPAVSAECLSAFVRVGGWCSVSEPPSAAARTGQRWPEEGCARLGLRVVGAVERPVGAVVLEKVGVLDRRFPRRSGALRKRPLWGVGGRAAGPCGSGAATEP
jgi:16S rRNA (guanine527-N7)-methyltransferase